MTFKATAYNEAGLTFQFSFCNTNWNGVEQAARAKLQAICYKDPLHEKNGPWFIRNIDVGV